MTIETQFILHITNGIHIIIHNFKWYTYMNSKKNNKICISTHNHIIIIIIAGIETQTYNCMNNLTNFVFFYFYRYYFVNFSKMITDTKLKFSLYTNITTSYPKIHYNLM